MSQVADATETPVGVDAGAFSMAKIKTWRVPFFSIWTEHDQSLEKSENKEKDFL